MAETTTTEKKTVQDQFKAREAESQAGINKIYDNSLNTQNQSLQDAFNANTQAQAQQRQNIQNIYNQAYYDVGVQNDRNDANLTQFADVRDLNHEEGSQHRLRLNNARNGANAKLAYAQAQALQESDRQAMLLETNYKNQVAAALADNDYKRAAALMDDYNNQDKWRQQQAEILASYGNFEPYKDIYGEGTAGTMQTMWNAQHPEEAYRMGRIDAGTYHNITGKYPAGYSSGGGGGYGWYGGGGVPTDPNTGKPLNQMQALAGFTNANNSSYTGPKGNGTVMSLASSGQTMKSTGFNRYHT